MEHRRHVWRTHAVRHRVTNPPRNMPRNYGKKDSQKVSLVRRGECVGRNNPKGRRLCPCAHTIVHPTASNSLPLGIPRRCPSLHPQSHTCQDCTPSPSRAPRTALRARRRRLPALYATAVARRQCYCHARRKLRQMRVRVMMQGAGSKGMT